MSQISYAKGSTDHPLIEMTIGDLFDQTVQQFADNDALIVVDQKIDYSYKTLQMEVNRTAKAFLSLGVNAGDRVGIWAPNCVQWTLCQFATAKIGAVLVNVNPAYQSYELEYTLNQSGISFLVMADAFKNSSFYDILASIAPELQSAKPGKLEAAKLPELHTVINLATQPKAGMYSWLTFIEYATDTTDQQLMTAQARLNCHQPINIQYTSGTTGAPKGVTLSHYNILNNGYFVGESLTLTDRDRLIIPVPLYHCFGMVMGNLGCITHGATMIYPSAAFDPEIVLQSIERYRATALYSVPTMFISMLEHPHFAQYDLTTLRTGIMAGSICPAEIMKAVNGKMHITQLQIAYGMTETSPVSVQTAANDPFDKRVSTVGRTQPHIESKIIDTLTGATVDRNVSGQLCTRGYSVMLGYWQDQSATDEVLLSDGWMHTGDLATMDDQGYIRIVGRIKDMVIRGGENIYPKEIEDFLYTHPDISDVQVVGIPDQKYGEELVAWIKLRPNAQPLDAQDIDAYCRGKISYYKIPRYVKNIGEYPLTVTGKVQKFKLREMAIAQLS